MCEREQEDWKCFLAPGCRVLKARTETRDLAAGVWV